MGRSPGHQQWPGHRVLEERIDGAAAVEAGDQAVAASRDAIRVVEDRHPDRVYFPRGDVQMALLRRSARTTTCPFKGTAHYFDVLLADRTLEEAAWSYEDPYDEHAALKDRLAFHDDRYPELRVRIERG